MHHGRALRLERPLGGSATLPRSEDIKPAVGVRPLELPYDRIELDLFRGIEHGKGMVAERCRCAQREQQGCANTRRAPHHLNCQRVAFCSVAFSSSPNATVGCSANIGSFSARMSASIVDMS